MAPYQMAALNGSLIEPSRPSQSSSYSFNEIIVNIIFGIFALAVGIISIWQGHRQWRLWHPVQQYGTYELEAIPPEQEGSDVDDNSLSSDMHPEPPSMAPLVSSDQPQAPDMDVRDVDPAPIPSSEASLMSPIGLRGDMPLQQPNITQYQARAQPSQQDINRAGSVNKQ
ncbi:MAG: hypothetical protein Q9195_004383 [Heterodermia aff. obscurata]